MRRLDCFNYLQPVILIFAICKSLSTVSFFFNPKPKLLFQLPNLTNMMLLTLVNDVYNFNLHQQIFCNILPDVDVVYEKDSFFFKTFYNYSYGYFHKYF